jgi:hypothetical protein
MIAVDTDSLYNAGSHIMALSEEVAAHGVVSGVTFFGTGGSPESIRFTVATAGLTADISSTVQNLALALRSTGVSALATAQMYRSVDGGVVAAFSAPAVSGVVADGAVTGPRPVASASTPQGAAAPSAAATSPPTWPADRPVVRPG